MALGTEGRRTSKSYDIYEATQLAKAQKRAAEYETMRRTQANAFASKVADTYNEALQNIERQYAASAQAAEKRYRAAHDVNVVSGLIARRETENVAENTSFRNDGLGATNHTALSLQKSRADHKVMSQKEKTANNIIRELDRVRSRYRMQSIAEQNAVHQAADAAVLAWRNAAEQSARNIAVALYGSQVESDEAVADRAWEEYLLEHYLDQIAKQQKKYDEKKQGNDNTQKIRRYIEIVNRYLKDMTGKTLEEHRQFEIQRRKVASQTELTPSQQEYYSRLGTGRYSWNSDPLSYLPEAPNSIVEIHKDDNGKERPVVVGPATEKDQAIQELYLNEHKKRTGTATRGLTETVMPTVTADNAEAMFRQLQRDIAVADAKHALIMSGDKYVDSSAAADTTQSYVNAYATLSALKEYATKSGDARIDPTDLADIEKRIAQGSRSAYENYVMSSIIDSNSYYADKRAKDYYAEMMGVDVDAVKAEVNELDKAYMALHGYSVFDENNRGIDLIRGEDHIEYDGAVYRSTDYIPMVPTENDVKSVYDEKLDADIFLQVVTEEDGNQVNMLTVFPRNGKAKVYREIANPDVFASEHEAKAILDKHGISAKSAMTGGLEAKIRMLSDYADEAFTYQNVISVESEMVNDPNANAIIAEGLSSLKNDPERKDYDVLYNDDVDTSIEINGGRIVFHRINRTEGTVSTKESNLSGGSVDDAEDLKLATSMYLLGKYGAEKMSRYTEAWEKAYYGSHENYQTAQEQIRAAEYAKDHEILASLSSFGSSLAGILSAPINMYDAQFRKGGIDENSSLNRYVQQGDIYRLTVADEIGGVGGQLYQAGMSAVDFLITYGIGKGVGSMAGAVGASATTASKAAQVTTLLANSSKAANAGMISANARGASSDQILMVGIVSALAEYFCEKMPLEHFEKLLGGGYSKGAIIKGLLAQGGTEAIEEGATSAVNFLADCIIMTDQSKYAIRKRELLKKGISEKEAASQALAEQFGQIGEEGWIGFLSGMMVVGGGVTGGAISQNTKFEKDYGKGLSGDQLKTHIGAINDEYRVIPQDGVTLEELTEAFKVGMEGRLYTPKTQQPSSDVDSLETQGYNGGETLIEQAEEQPLSDEEQFEQYAEVLQELAPSSFEEFQTIRNTDPKRFKELENQYKVVSQYKIDSGSLSATEIWQLDKKTYSEKAEKFAIRFREQGNIAGAYLDGDFNNMHFAHSRINTETGLVNGYNGSNQMVVLKNNRRFLYTDVRKANGDIRKNTFYDTEAKLFEYFADLYEEKPFKSITILSERGMCDSCKGVMEQFKKQFPDVTVNVVSNNSVEGNVWGWRRRK